MVVPFRNTVDHFCVRVIAAPHQRPAAQRLCERWEPFIAQEYVMMLSMLGTTIGSMAREVRELQKNEFGELSESSHKGGVGVP